MEWWGIRPNNDTLLVLSGDVHGKYRDPKANKTRDITILPCSILLGPQRPPFPVPGRCHR